MSIKCNGQSDRSVWSIYTDPKTKCCLNAFFTDNGCFPRNMVWKLKQARLDDPE